MYFQSEKHEKAYNRIKKYALENGFTEEELLKHNLERLFHQTKSKRMWRMINLAYYLGMLNGIKHCDEIFYTKIVKGSEGEVESK